MAGLATPLTTKSYQPKGTHRHHAKKRHGEVAVLTPCGRMVLPLAYTCKRRLRLKGYFISSIQVYAGIGILIVEVYERIGTSVMFGLK